MNISLLLCLGILDMLLLEVEVSFVHGQLDLGGGVCHQLVDPNEGHQEDILDDDEHALSQS